MYRLLNFLFGWDYIYWDNSSDSGIARVYVSPDGVVYYYRYRSITYIEKITSIDQVLWLTCKGEKYMR